MYYALYRKYRPKTFSEVVGQDHVTKTLKKQIETNKFAHAYLFTGTRGTGKTSCAKIFARAINCLNPSFGEPCNHCEICKGLLDESIYDVIEIDAASNNGVDNIRQIRDEIIYAPIKAKYKVYIIDEVHMLSAGAFNALLKTLEEPPSHVVFILATTEAHKIPATILSRCQRFDMLRLNIPTISKQIHKILQLENQGMPEEIIRLIADLADGSVRDALSILEKVLELEDPSEIKHILGIIDKKMIYNVCDMAAKGDVGEIYNIISDLYASSNDLALFCHDLLMHFRELLIVKTAKNFSEILEKSPEDTESLQKSAEIFSVEHILYAMDILEQTLQSLPKSTDKRASVEICMLKIASPSLNSDYQALLTRISKIEDKLKTNNFKISDNITKNEKPKTEENIVSSESVKTFKKEETKEVMQEPPSPAVENIKNEYADDSNTSSTYKELLSWDDITNEIKKVDRRLSLTLSRCCSALYKDKEILIICKSQTESAMLKDPKNIEIINRALEEDRKMGYSIKTVIGKTEDYLKQDENIVTYQDIENNELFKF